MFYRTLGRTGLHVSVLSLGTVQLGVDYGVREPGLRRPAQDQAVRIVQAALDTNINFIDTARGYGHSEQIVGEAIRDRREKVLLATKVAVLQADGTVPDASAFRRRMRESLETSLVALQTDYIDLWQIHDFDQTLLELIPEVKAVFDEAQRSGKVRWVGSSIYPDKAPFAALEADFCDVVQVPYSVFDQRLAPRFFPEAEARKVGIVGRSALLKGALTASAEHLPAHLNALRDRSRAYRKIVADAEIGLTPAQAAIAFAVAQEQIHTLLVGVRSEAELQEDVRAISRPLPADLMAAMRSLQLEDPALLNPYTWGFQ